MDMQLFSKAVAFLLLSAVIVAPLAAQGLYAGVSAQERPAGCHEDSGTGPVPAPASHSCCQVAHHPAILQQSSTFWTSLHGSARVDSTPHSVAVARPHTFPNLLIVLGDPPMLSPLRV